MIDQILRKHRKTLWKRDMLSVASLESSFIDIKLWTENFSVPRDESCLLPFNFIDVVRQAQTIMGHYKEHNIDDYWSIDGEPPQRGSWVGWRDSQFWRGPSTRRTYVGRRKTDTYSIHVQASWHLAGSMVENVQAFSTSSKTAVGCRQIKGGLCTPRRLRVIHYVASDDHEFFTVIKDARSKSETHMESAMPCKAPRTSEEKTLKTSVSASLVELCAEAQLGETFVHQRRRNINYSPSSRDWCLRISTMPHPRRRRTKSRRAYCRPRIQFCESLQVGSSADACSKSNEHSGSKGGSG